MTITAVYLINWTEYESGWGQRPDGASIHRTKEIAMKFRNSYEASDNSYECFVRGDDPVLIEATPEMLKALGDKDSAWFKHSGNV